MSASCMAITWADPPASTAPRQYHTLRPLPRLRGASPRSRSCCSTAVMALLSFHNTSQRCGSRSSSPRACRQSSSPASSRPTTMWASQSAPANSATISSKAFAPTSDARQGMIRATGRSAAQYRRSRSRSAVSRWPKSWSVGTTPAWLKSATPGSVAGRGPRSHPWRRNHLVRVAGVSDLPPADWYTDPEDESQYRYWDGSSWTEHRAPRIAGGDGEAGDATGGLRSPTKLVADTFSLTGRRWRPCAAVALIYILGQIAGVVLLIVAANYILMGELGEIYDRASQPGFDPSEPQHEAYFQSLEVDLAPINFVPALLGLLAVWVATNVMQAAVARIALGDLRERALTTSEALTQALRRVPRLMGVQLQLALIFAAILAAMVFAGIAAPLLLIPLLLALLVAAVYAVVLITLAYIVASAGPHRWSLPYSSRLPARTVLGDAGTPASRSPPAVRREPHSGDPVHAGRDLRRNGTRVGLATGPDGGGRRAGGGGHRRRSDPLRRPRR